MRRLKKSEGDYRLKGKYPEDVAVLTMKQAEEAVVAPSLSVS